MLRSKSWTEEEGGYQGSGVVAHRRLSIVKSRTSCCEGKYGTKQLSTEPMYILRALTVFAIGTFSD